MVAPHVGRQKPLHPTAEIPIRMRPQRQVKMIRQYAIGKDSHRNPLTGQPDQLDKRPVITVLMEYLDLRVASIDDVITNAAYRSSGRAWHMAIYLGPCWLLKRKVECPLFLVLFLVRMRRRQQIIDDLPPTDTRPGSIRQLHWMLPNRTEHPTGSTFSVRPEEYRQSNGCVPPPLPIATQRRAATATFWEGKIAERSKTDRTVCSFSRDSAKPLRQSNDADRSTQFKIDEI